MYDVKATFASKIEVVDGGKRLQVTREVDGGLETVAVDVPAVITTDLRYMCIVYLCGTDTQYIYI